MQSLNNEIDTLARNKYINDKLLIIALYGDLCVFLERVMPEETFKEYETVIKSCFTEKIMVNYCNGEETEAEEFFLEFLNKLSNANMLSLSRPVQTAIFSYRENFDFIASSHSYVSVIEKQENLSFNKKAKITLIVKDYIRSMCEVIVDLYGEVEANNTKKELLTYIKGELDKYLQDMTPKQDLEEISNVLRYKVRDYLIDKFDKGEFNEDSFGVESLAETFKSHKDIEKKIWLLSIIYTIAGYKDDDKKMHNEYVKDVRKKLKLSRLRYFLVTSSLAITMTKNMYLLNTVESEEEYTKVMRSRRGKQDK